VSYRKEDHLPVPDRKCILCGEKFVPQNWCDGVCEDCKQEIRLDEEEELDEDHS
jgi:hypothetical protein